MKITLLFLFILGFISCEIGSTGSSSDPKKDDGRNNGGKEVRVGVKITKDSPRAAQAIAGKEYCSQQITTYENNKDYYIEHVFLNADGSFRIFEKGMNTGGIINEARGKWGASEFNFAYEVGGKTKTHKMKLSNSTLSLLEMENGKEVSYDYSPCDGSVIDNPSPETPTRGTPPANGDRDVSTELKTIIDQQFCDLNIQSEEGVNFRSAMIFKADGRLMFYALAYQTDAVLGQNEGAWQAGQNPKALKVTIEGKTVELNFIIQVNGLTIFYVDPETNQNVQEQYERCKFL